MVSFPFAAAVAGVVAGAADDSRRKWSRGNRLDDSPSDSRPKAGCKPSGVEARRYDSRRRESCVNGVWWGRGWQRRSTTAAAAPEGERENRERGWGTVKVPALDKPTPRRPAPRSRPRPPPPSRYRLAASRGPSNDYQNDTESPASDCRCGGGRTRRAFKFNTPVRRRRGQRSLEKCSVKVAPSAREILNRRAEFAARPRHGLSPPPISS